jgi:DNA primase
MTGFGGRVLRPEDVPKFLNSPQTVLFDKSSLLYGLDRARKPIRREDRVVIVEGYMDVIVLHQEGFENTVSPMGTALTEAQMRQLKRFTRRFILALDPDAAGVKATLRGLEVARETLDRSTDMVFDARGLLHHEGRLQADLRVSALPDERDPDEIVLRNPEEWRAILENAKPIIYHVLDTLTEGQNLSDPKVKSQIAARILPLIQDVPDPVERDAYRQQIARVLQVSEGALLLFSKQRAGKSRTRRRKDAPPPAAVTILQETESIAQNRRKLMEQQVLGFLIRDPRQVYRVNRCLHTEGLARATADDMALSEHQQVLAVVLESLTQDALDPDEFVRENLADEFDLFPDFKLDQGNGADENVKAADDTRELEEVVRLLIELRRADTNALISQLRFLQAEMDNDEPEARQISDPARLVKLIQQRGLLDKALSKPIRIDR